MVETKKKKKQRTFLAESGSGGIRTGTTGKGTTISSGDKSIKVEPGETIVKRKTGRGQRVSVGSGPNVGSFDIQEDTGKKRITRFGVKSPPPKSAAGNIKLVDQEAKSFTPDPLEEKIKQFKLEAEADKLKDEALERKDTKEKSTFLKDFFFGPEALRENRTAADFGPGIVTTGAVSALGGGLEVVAQGRPSTAFAGNITGSFSQGSLKSSVPIAKVFRASSSTATKASGIAKEAVKTPQSFKSLLGRNKGKIIGGGLVGGFFLAKDVAETGVLASWAATDNVIQASSFQSNNLIRGVEEGIISKEEGLQRLAILEENNDYASGFIDTQIELNPFLWREIGKPMQIAAENNRADMELKRATLEQF